MSRSIREYLEHIHAETRFLLTNSTDLDESRFFDDEILKRAFTRSLEIIGEASKQIPQSIRDKYPAIPWREMTGMRDRLIHQYSGVNYLVVWETVTLDIPDLEEKIGMLLEQDEF